MKNKILFAGVTVFSMVAAPAVWAGSLTIPNTFTSGTPAKAAEVNANFSAVKTEVDDNDSRITANKTASDANTTHRQGDGSDHSDVAANTQGVSTNAAAIQQNASGISSNATAIQQNAGDISNNATAIQNNANAITPNTTHRNSDGKDHSDVVLNNTHRTGDGSDHGNVVLNDSHRLGDGSDHADVAANTTAIAGLTGNPSSLACQGNDANDIMVRVGPLCVDKYEASVWDTIDGTGTQYGAGTGAIGNDNYPCADNANDCTGTSSIFARSQAGVTPSGSITWFQAQQACTAAGKRLLTNAEWQAAAAGTDKANCNVTSGSVANTGANASCVSNWGVVNMVGNLNEWVADWIQGVDATQYDVALNPSGNATINSPNYNSGDLGTNYDNDVAAGTQRSTGNSGPENFPAAVYRGGGFGGGGVFTFNSTYAPSYTPANGVVGFRCAR